MIQFLKASASVAVHSVFVLALIGVAEPYQARSRRARVRTQRPPSFWRAFAFP
jgi:hypothetical protein